MIARLAEHTDIPADLDPAYVARLRAWIAAQPGFVARRRSPQPAHPAHRPRRRGRRDLLTDPPKEPTMSLAQPLGRTLLVALAALALTSPTALAEPFDQPPTAAQPQAAQDLRSPDTRDAAARHQQDLRRQDLRRLSAGATIHPSSPARSTAGNKRSALAQERYYSSSTRPVPPSHQPASAGASGDGIAPVAFVLAVVAALSVGLGAGSRLHLVRDRRRDATSMAT